MRSTYMEHRCERWGKWREGVRGQQVSPLFRALNGLPRAPFVEGAVPRDYSEEQETDALTKKMSQEERFLLLKVYPRKIRTAKELGITDDDLCKRIDAAHKRMLKMLDQRKRGETIDPNAQRPRIRTKLIRINNHKAAAVAE